MGKQFAISARFVQVLLAEEATRKAQYTHNEVVSVIGTSLVLSVFSLPWSVISASVSLDSVSLGQAKRQSDQSIEQLQTQVQPCLGKLLYIAGMLFWQ